MAVRIFDIYQLYGQVFGAGVGLPFPSVDLITDPSVDPPMKGSFNFQSPNGGGLYHLPIKMGTSPIMKNQYQLPNEPIMGVKGSKMIKVTPLRRGAGRGTVKEERGLNDYRITIKGLCINESGSGYPQDQVTKIRQLCEAEGVIYITSFLTDLWSVKKLTIKDWSFDRYASNSIRVQPYVIEAISDMDYEDFARIINGSPANVDFNVTPINPNSVIT